MGSSQMLKNWSQQEEHYYEGRKFLFLGLTFFFIVAAYTLTYELKNSIFVFIVGREYIARAKLISLMILVPAILFYSKLVDSLRRYYLVCVYTAFYAILSVVFAYFLGHPTIGLSNTDASPYRLFGWLFYFFIEGYSPFVISVFWAFSNSITNPDAAKERYGYMVSYSKVGGMFSASVAWLLLSWRMSNGMPLFSDIASHQLLVYISGLMLGCVPFIIFYLIRVIPGRFLHGYEAVYRMEKEKSKQSVKAVGLFDGLTLLLQYPYVMGIFGMVFFYEITIQVLSYLRISLARSSAHNISDMSGELFKTMFIAHLVGFFISLFGTGRLLKWLGEKRCLMLIPAVSGILLVILVLSHHNMYAVLAAFIVLKSVNYAFSLPVRESLYIPTIKEIKFKSKSWIDAFGSKFAKTSGGLFNSLAEGLPVALFLSTHMVFFGVVVGLWFLTAYVLGNNFEKAVENGKVIGASDSV